MLKWQVGDVTITRIVEMETVGGTRFLLPQATYDAVREIEWLQPHFANEVGKLKMSIHALVVETPTRRLIVDTCIGNDRKRDVPQWSDLQTTFLEDLATAGFPPDSFDTVLCTHLHVDHVGWNTRWVGARWVPTFANARYLFARKEWEHWAAEAGAREAAGQGGGAPDDVLGDSVRPILDAGLAELVDTDHRLTDEVGLEPTPGHTPGHVSVRIESAGQRAVITGDLMHHPIQCAEPDRLGNFDHDAEQARATRRYFLACCARDRTLVFGTHFAPPTAGHVVAADGAWRFDAQ